jgi:hypothetical protein
MPHRGRAYRVLSAGLAAGSSPGGVGAPGSRRLGAAASASCQLVAKPDQLSPRTPNDAGASCHPDETPLSSCFGSLTGTFQVGAGAHQYPSKAALGDLDRGCNISNDDVGELSVHNTGRRVRELERNG